MIKSKVNLLAALCFTVSVCAGQNHLKDSIDVFVKERLQDYSGVILIAVNEEIIYQGTYGLKDNKNEFPNEIGTAFKIGSITKPFTSTAIMILEQQGKLKLSDSIAKYIDGLPKTWSGITIHELLTHTSGLMHSWDLKDFAKYFEGTKDWQSNDVIKLYFDQPVNIDKTYHYSGLGYFVLARIIEITSKTSYNKYLDSLIFKRLDMSSTYGYQAHGKNSNLSTGHDSKGSPITLTNSSFLYGGGNLVSTASDLFKFDCSFYHNVLLDKVSTEKVFSPFVKNSNNNRYYGYGWVIQDKNGLKLIAHSGIMPGFISYYVRIPELKLFFAFLSNEEVNNIKIVDELTSYIAKLVKKH